MFLRRTLLARRRRGVVFPALVRVVRPVLYHCSGEKPGEQINGVSTPRAELPFSQILLQPHASATRHTGCTRPSYRPISAAARCPSIVLRTWRDVRSAASVHTLPVGCGHGVRSGFPVSLTTLSSAGIIRLVAVVKWDFHAPASTSSQVQRTLYISEFCRGAPGVNNRCRTPSARTPAGSPPAAPGQQYREPRQAGSDWLNSRRMPTLFTSQAFEGW